MARDAVLGEGLARVEAAGRGREVARRARAQELREVRGVDALAAGALEDARDEELLLGELERERFRAGEAAVREVRGRDEGRHLRGFQSFNPTSMCAYSNDLDRTLWPYFENSTRAIDSPKNQPNRL